MRLLLHQAGYEWKAFWRNPPAVFFGGIFPLIFFVIFNLLFGNEEIRIPGGVARASTFYVPAIAAMSIVNSCFTGLATGAAISRDRGVLKRVRGTPLPASTYLAARVLVVSLVAVCMVGIVVAAGALFSGVSVPTNTMPAFIVTLVLGAACFASLGLAVAAIGPNADAAPAVINAIVLPLLFISDIFISPGRAPAWLTTVADIFPIRHLSSALQTAFNPFETGLGFKAADLLVLALWGIGGALVAWRYFSWEPRS